MTPEAFEELLGDVYRELSDSHIPLDELIAFARDLRDLAGRDAPKHEGILRILRKVQDARTMIRKWL